ncbi:hypothetical protein BDN71DRAFT_1572844 [Pleurotus eryngii]|uniref:DUF6570 domain-containing protein n=1 Tax=Pleurotus eryngii TaxID=5323 RepID=A0A9P5ZS95_PLEER|nr:hypothetical protein BDN71DRAFT_1572844 [Pleurotus eryngii]
MSRTDMDADDLSQLATAFSKLTIVQAVVVSEAEGLTISRKERRLQTTMLAKWRGQSPDLFTRLDADVVSWLIATLQSSQKRKMDDLTVSQSTLCPPKERSRENEQVTLGTTEWQLPPAAKRVCYNTWTSTTDEPISKTTRIQALIDSKFLTLVEDEVLQDRATEYIAATGNNALARVTCALKQKRTPPLSLANNMWIGDIPPELSSLTLPEQVLIAQYFPAAYIVKLYPKNHNMHLDPRTLASGLKGNVTSYPLDVKALGQFITGNRLPVHPRVLTATIGITFIGLHNAPEKALKGLFRVGRTRVAVALQWLQANNPIYKHIKLDVVNIAALPEDDVLIELQQTVKMSTSEEVLEQEHGGYVPEDGILDPQGSDKDETEDCEEDGELQGGERVTT